MSPRFQLLAITGEDWSPASAWLADLARAGVDALEVRAKQLEDRSLLAAVTVARQGFPNTLLVNGRADIARAAGASGVHLPAAGLPIPRLREAFGSALLIGRSTHSVAEVEAAREEGADYVTFGPVYDTPGKARFGAPRGLAELAEASRRLPVYALGGVTLERLDEVAAAGAAGVAAIRLFLAGPGELQHTVERARRLFPAAGTNTAARL